MGPSPPPLAVVRHDDLDATTTDAVVEVYRAAFTAPGYDETADDVERFRTGLPRHAAREGFRLVVAASPDGGSSGFAYGYTGQPGQWWTDRLLERIPHEITDRWVGGHFEFVELAVRPEVQGRGIGRALHDALLDGIPHRRALLGTWPDDRPARRLYQRAGWRDLAPIDDDSVLMGLELG
jgi:ribosomal protein S18 acetylase RimI-like enzyme